MSKIGRNDPCPCGSGRKYKHCCLGKKLGSSRKVVGVFVDPEDQKVVVGTDDMLINQFRRDGPKIEASFDRLYMSDLRELGALQAAIATLILAGLRHATRSGDELRSGCAELLLNALNNFAAAVQVLRSGYVLAPGVLARNIVEMLAVVAHVYVNPDDLPSSKRGEFQSTRALASAKRVLPVFGPLYGFLSKNYAHMSQVHHSLQPLRPYKEKTAPLEINLSFLRASLWLAYVVTELVFWGSVVKPRYWSYQGKGTFMFSISENERAWLKEFLKQAYSEDVGATRDTKVETKSARDSDDK